MTALTVKELIEQLSKIEDQNTTVYIDEGAVYLDCGRVELREFTNRDGVKVNHVVLS